MAEEVRLHLFFILRRKKMDDFIKNYNLIYKLSIDDYKKILAYILNNYSLERRFIDDCK